jgi:P4 family phage/plasmid primase-like protien
MTEKYVDTFPCKDCNHCFILKDGEGIYGFPGKEYYWCRQKVLTRNCSGEKEIGEIEDVNDTYCRGKYWEKRTAPPLKPISNVMFGSLSQGLDLYKNIQRYIKYHPVYYDDSRNWWVWDKAKYCWKLVDETDILVGINKVAEHPNIHSNIKNQLLESFKQLGRINKPKKAAVNWIQFKKWVYCLNTNEHFEANHKYFITNPIPHELGTKTDTPTIDILFKSWVDKKHIKFLYEILAYCMLPNYPIHRIFCLNGEGMNGKSTFLKLLRKFIGSNNVTTAELDTLINSRFDKVRLHKKLVCTMGETDFNEMRRTSMLKQLTGGDLIPFEYKNKDPFEDVNYAKIIIATNNIPPTNDKTIGFYRRWCIIDFPNKFDKEKDILSTIPKEEYNNLALKCIKILKNLLKKGEFTNEGTIEERMKKYEDKSNPFDKFWKENVDEVDPNGYISKRDFRKKLEEWCKENRFRMMSDRTIAQHMKEKDVKTQHIQANWFDKEGKKPLIWSWSGIKWLE